LLFIPILGFSQNLCLPGTAKSYLDLNNVSALIENGGSMWRDRDHNAPAYEVPKGSGETVIFAGSVWMGGIDINNQLHLAALKYRDGDDFWPGPVKINNPSTFDSTCLEFDRVWKINKWEVEEFILKYQDQTYTIPEVILNWPGNGNTQQNYAQNLAPYHDENNDGIYNPYDGDYPEFNLHNSLSCDAPQLYGDQCIYYIMNDVGNTHTESGGIQIGVEIHAQAFAFQGNESLNNSTFYNYKIINRSLANYTDFYFGNWVDLDIGCSEDDYIGCDVSRGLGFGFNADGVDDGCQYAINGNPPAIGIDFVRGPKQDADGIDNPLTNDVNIAYNSDGLPYDGLGFGYGDGIVDNERLGMQKFVYFDRTLQQNIYGDPTIGVEFYNYMLGNWRDNTPLVYGGTGNSADANATSILTSYSFPGDSDPLNWATVSAGGAATVPFSNWSEQSPIGPGSSPNPQGDRRMVPSVGPVTFNSNDTIDVMFSAIYAKSLSSDPYQSVEKMKLYDDTIQEFTNNCFETNNCLKLVSDFQYQNNGQDFHFAYKMEADVYSWTFGDGTSSNERFPKHTYTNSGTHNVCLIASKFDCSSIAFCKNVSDTPIFISEIIHNNLSIYPNPTNNLIQIEIENYNGSFEAELYDFTGKLLETTNSTSFSLADYPTGIYLLKVAYGDRVEQLKVVKE
jgi:hypothetical protein